MVAKLSLVGIKFVILMNILTEKV